MNEPYVPKNPKETLSGLPHSSLEHEPVRSLETCLKSCGSDPLLVVQTHNQVRLLF